MERSKSFRDTQVWQKAHVFVLKVYVHTKTFPKDERYGLTSQFRRAAISVAANIAEGFVRRSNRDKRRFYNISQGSLEECRYYLLLSRDLGYGESAELEHDAETVSKLLYSYIKALEKQIPGG